jgi:tight adherence protein B
VTGLLDGVVPAAVGVAVWLACPVPSGPLPPDRTGSGDRPAGHPRAQVLLALLGLSVALLTAGVVPLRLLVLGSIGLLAVLATRRIWGRRRDRLAAAETSRRVLGACEVVAAELAAGRPADAALAQAAGQWSGLAPVVEAHDLGSDVPDALRRLASTPGAGELRVVASAWQVSQHSGHGLADALSRVAARIRARRQTRRVVTSELASARATARLVAALPVVALGMGSGAGGDPWGFLLGTPVGWGCLGLGLAFGLLGLWWIEAIADGVDRP